MNGITLDAGALIALDRNHRGVIALLARSKEKGWRVTIPASALAQALRDPKQQARLSRLVRQPDTDVIPLDRRDAAAIGLRLARTGTRDVVDAHVVICAERAAQAVATSDPQDLARLSPALSVIAV